MNFRSYITYIIFSGLVFTKTATAQSYLKLESRLVFNKPTKAQSYLKLEGAQVFSILKFTSKIGNQDIVSVDNPSYSHITVGAFSLNYEFTKSNGLFFLAGIGMRGAGSSLIYKNINYNLNMQYVDVKGGVGYEFNKWRLRPYAAILPYFAYLLEAKQSIGTNYYDIKATKSIKNSDFGLFMPLGFKAVISPYISIYTEYNYILGLKNIETDRDQYLYNRGFSIKLGLSLNITSSSKSSEKIPKEPFDLLAHKPDPGFIIDIPTSKLPTPTIPEAETTAPKNTDISSTISAVHIKEIPVIENKPEKDVKEVVTVKNFIPEPLSNTGAEIQKVPVIENQGKGQGVGFESVKKNTSDASRAASSITKISTKEVAKNNNSNVSSKNKLEKEAISPSRLPPVILFKIQIGSVSKPLGLNHPFLKKISGKIEKEIGKDGMTRYYSGIFESYEEARAFLHGIKLKGGYEGAFVVAFKNGKQITVYEAKKLVQ